MKEFALRRSSTHCLNSKALAAADHYRPGKLLMNETIIKEIDKTVGDSELYQRGKEPPSTEAVETAKRLISYASIPDSLSKPEIAVIHGELDVTWHHSGKMVRLILSSNGKPPVVCFCKWYGKDEGIRFVEATNSNVFTDAFAWLKKDSTPSRSTTHFV